VRIIFPIKYYFEQYVVIKKLLKVGIFNNKLKLYRKNLYFITNYDKLAESEKYFKLIQKMHLNDEKSIKEAASKCYSFLMDNKITSLTNSLSIKYASMLKWIPKEIKQKIQIGAIIITENNVGNIKKLLEYLKFSMQNYEILHKCYSELFKDTMLFSKIHENYTFPNDFDISEYQNYSNIDLNLEKNIPIKAESQKIEPKYIFESLLTLKNTI